MGNELSPAEIAELFGMKKRLKQMKRKSAPSMGHCAFIPKQLKSPVIYLESRDWKENQFPTLFVGSIAVNYTEEMWETDVKRWETFLHDDKSPSGKIKLQPIADSPQVLDSIDAIEKIEQARVVLKNYSIHSLRIVVIGMQHSDFLFDAIEYLLNEWKGPKEEKLIEHVEFLTAGDTDKHKIERFAKWLCLSGACKNLTFVNTQEYHPFGSLRLEFKN